MVHERGLSAPPSSVEQGCAVCGGTVADLSRCADCGAPQEVAGFKILRQLAKPKTAHSRMFLAERGGVRVALKELLFALVPEVSQLEAFDREARLLRQLKHQSIPRFVDSFQAGAGAQTRLYLAQEFVDGRSLLEELHEHRFDEQEAQQIAVQVLEILRYLHGRSPQVIHRDLKPANLIRRTDGQIVLVDFGAARDLRGGVTHGSTLVGTFGYMPPEQGGGTVDPTADLYALGATMIHLLAQRPPNELMRQGAQLDFRIDFRGAIHAAPGMVGVLERLVDPDRRARFKTADAVLDALQFLNRVSSDELSQNARPTARGERSSRRLSEPMAAKVDDADDVVYSEQVREGYAPDSPAGLLPQALSGSASLTSSPLGSLTLGNGHATGSQNSPSPSQQTGGGRRHRAGVRKFAKGNAEAPGEKPLTISLDEIRLALLWHTHTNAWPGTHVFTHGILVGDAATELGLRRSALKPIFALTEFNEEQLEVMRRRIGDPPRGFDKGVRLPRWRALSVWVEYLFACILAGGVTTLAVEGNIRPWFWAVIGSAGALLAHASVRRLRATWSRFLFIRQQVADLSPKLLKSVRRPPKCPTCGGEEVWVWSGGMRVCVECKKPVPLATPPE